MKEIKIKDVIEICNAKLICGNKEDVLTNFSKDTRTINKNDTYIGIKGETFDGNLFFEDALKKGASTCIIQKVDISDKIKEIYKNKNIIIVEDSIKALQQIAAYKRTLYNIPVVAITGSVGKTSTKDMIESVIKKQYKVLKTKGNLNNGIGLPLTILELKDHEALVVEMGMNHLGEIELLSKIANPTVAVITNIGTSHIGNLGSRENILKAKMEITEGLEQNGTIILNNDNDLLYEWNKENKSFRTRLYGIDHESELKISDINMEENSSTYELEYKNKKYKVYVPVGGKHFIYNSLCAILVGIQLNIDMDLAINGIAEFNLTANRMEVITIKKNITIINDIYNASFDSIKAVLEYMYNRKEKRKIAVLGDILELGEFSKQIHEDLAQQVINNKIDILVTVGSYSKYLAKKVVELGMNEGNVYITLSNKEAIEVVTSIMKPEDLVLLKASNGMKFFEILEKIKERVYE